MELHASIRATATGNEYYHLVVCEEATIVLKATEYWIQQENQTLLAIKTYTLSGTSTTHGSMYHATVSICNIDGCHETEARTVTVTKEVDGHPTAINMVVNANAGMTAWDVTWETDGDTSDVAWRVCYSDFDKRCDMLDLCRCC